MATREQSAHRKLTEELPEFVEQLSFGEVPDEPRERAIQAIIDTLGVTLAGADADAGEIPAHALAMSKGQDGEATLFGRSDRADFATAALINGTAAHAIDYDDSAFGTAGHPSAPIVSAVFAAAERASRTINGRDLLTAYLAGFEAQSFIACVTRRTDPEGNHTYEAGIRHLGWHPTGVHGVFGATAGVSKVLSLNEEQIRNALNIATSLPSGLRINFGSMTKPLHAGWAAHAGVVAGSLASEGFTANDAALTGEGGFYEVYAEQDDVSPDQFHSPGNPWIISHDVLGINFKKYPSCNGTHPGMDVARKLADEHDIAPDDIAAIEARVPDHREETLPFMDPETETEAKFCVPYTVAAAIEHDTVQLETFKPENLDDPRVRKLQDRVDVIYETGRTDRYKTTVSIMTKSGEEFEHTQVYPADITGERLREKFLDCARVTLSEQQATELYDLLDDIQNVSSVATITDAVSLKAQ